MNPHPSVRLLRRMPCGWPAFAVSAAVLVVAVPAWVAAASPVETHPVPPAPSWLTNSVAPVAAASGAPAAVSLAVAAPALPPLIHANVDASGRPAGLIGRGRDARVAWDSRGWTITRYGPAPSPAAIERRLPRIQRFSSPQPGDPSELGMWQPPAPRTTADVRVDLVGANRETGPVGEQPLGGTWNVLHGQRSRWQVGLPTYGGVTYAEAWPGVDVVWSVTSDGLRAEIVAQPGADLTRVAFAVTGGTIQTEPGGAVAVRTATGPAMLLSVEGLNSTRSMRSASRSGSIGLRLPLGSFELRPADADGGLVRLVVEPTGGAAVLRLARVSGNDSAVVDAERRATWSLDPSTTGTNAARGRAVAGAIVYSGLWGLDSEDRGLGVAVGTDGAAYVCGHAGVILKDNVDAFVYKVTPAGDRIAWVTVFGGDAEDTAFDVAVDTDGRATFAGATVSSEASLPVVGGPDLTYGGNQDALVGRLKPDGQGFDWLGYIGGGGIEFAEGVVVDKAGASYVTGVTTSRETSFPTKVGPDLTQNGRTDTFIVKLTNNPTAANRLDNIVYGGYIGGPDHDVYVYNDDQGNQWVTTGHVAIDKAGAAYISGATKNDQSTFPDGDGFGDLPGADQTFGGAWDVWAAKVRPDGTGLAWATFAGGAGEDLGFGMGVDEAGSALFTGWTDSHEDTMHPVGGPDLTFNGDSDAMAAKLTPDGRAWAFLGYVGGDAGDAGVGSTVDPQGRLVIVGYTGSRETSFPAVSGPDLTFNGVKPDEGDGFVAMIRPDPTHADPRANLAYAGYIGGRQWDQAFWVATDASGAAYVAGDTLSGMDTFPDGQGRGTGAGFGDGNPAGVDAFLVKLAPAPPEGEAISTAAPPSVPTVVPSAVPTVGVPAATPTVPAATPTATALPSHSSIYLPRVLDQSAAPGGMRPSFSRTYHGGLKR